MPRDEGSFRGAEIAVALFVAAAAQVASVSVFENADTHAQQSQRADISDDNAKPIPVNIVPLPDPEKPLPLLKLGSKDPSALPDMWQKPQPKLTTTQKPTEKKEDIVAPSTSAKATASAIPDAGVTPDATPSSDLDAEVVAKGPELDAAGAEASVDPKYAAKGSAAGDVNGTETDPAKAQAVDLYRSQLNGWFSARFAIKGKLPFDELKKLVALTVVKINANRQVESYSVSKPSGNATFDQAVESTLARIKGNGEILPAPPPMYPDIIDKPFYPQFACTNEAACK